MLTVAALLFAIAALGGAYLAIRHLQGQALPGGLAIVHGAAAAIALMLLLIAVLENDSSGWSTAALIAFVIAALGGFLLASFHLRGERHPGSLIVIHGGVAVVAFALLLIAILV